MTYIRFDFEESKPKENNSVWETMLSSLLEKVLPKANPTLESCIGKVHTWYVEYDTSGNFVNREIGVDNGGSVIFKAPSEDNLGYWCDNALTLEDFKRFHPICVSAYVFNELWQKR